MNLSKLTTIAGLLCLCACTTKEKKSFTINGTITGEVPELLYVYYENKQDSVWVNGNKFQLEGTLDNDVAEISFGTDGYSKMIDNAYIENKEIEMHLEVQKKEINHDEMNFFLVHSLNGTETSRRLSEFEKFKKYYNTKNTWSEEFTDMLASFLRENPKHPINFELVLDNYRVNYINRFQYESLIGLLDTSFVSKERIDFLRNHSDTQRKINEGDRMFDFKLSNIDNELISTKKYRGNWLYIDFWASWCVPCRVKKSKLVDIYNDYKHKGFEVLGVSMDKDEDLWRSVVEADSLNWENVIDTRAFDGDIAQHYSLIGTPCGILVNPFGEIEQINTSSNTEVLRKRLEKELLTAK